MEYGIYANKSCNFDKILSESEEHIRHIFVGDYGCPHRSMAIDQILNLSRNAIAKNKRIHYISPKVTSEYIHNEKLKITELLNHPVDITINDWGLLYALQPVVKKENNIYIGRLLTKSFGDKIRIEDYFSNENEQVVEYLKQNNFNDLNKINFFRDYGVKGVEVNVSNVREKSYQRIIDYGFSVIGYFDYKIVTILRSCPLKRINDSKCSEYCLKHLKVMLSNEQSDLSYPNFELWGNNLMQPITNTIEWDGYTKIVSVWKE